MIAIASPSSDFQSHLVQEEGDKGSTEALDDGVLLPKSPFPPPFSCSLIDMPFIILLLM